MHCRFDNQPIRDVFIDLGFSPLSNALLTSEDLNEGEIHYPLKVYVSDRTFLVQLDVFEKAEDIFSKEYVYHSSFSDSWLKHCKQYCDEITRLLNLDQNSFVVEIASNDGYLLKNFLDKKIPSLGIEPSESVANEARKKGISTMVKYFDSSLVDELIAKYRKPDLIICNNVLAHVPDINSFVSGLKGFLHDEGTITVEVPHLAQLVQNNQFDTIYHEHFWYFSLFALTRVFNSAGLRVYDVEEIPTHGGSIRVFICHDFSKIKNQESVQNLLDREIKLGINSLSYYQRFARRVYDLKIQFLEFILEAKRNKKSIAGYGAAAKGNTLINYFGIGKEEIDYIVDRSPFKQNKYAPGSHIPIVDIHKLEETKPDYIIIFPWNIKDEIMDQLSFTKAWGAQFVIPIPSLAII